MKLEGKDYKKCIKLFNELINKVGEKEILEDGYILDQIRYEVLHKMKIIGD